MISVYWAIGAFFAGIIVGVVGILRLFLGPFKLW